MYTFEQSPERQPNPEKLIQLQDGEATYLIEIGIEGQPATLEVTTNKLNAILEEIEEQDGDVLHTFPIIVEGYWKRGLIYPIGDEPRKEVQVFRIKKRPKDAWSDMTISPDPEPTNFEFITLEAGTKIYSIDMTENGTPLKMDAAQARLDKIFAEIELQKGHILHIFSKDVISPEEDVTYINGSEPTRNILFFRIQKESKSKSAWSE